MEQTIKITLPEFNEFDEWLEEQHPEVKKRVRANLAYRPNTGSAITMWFNAVNKERSRRYVIHMPDKDYYVGAGYTFKMHV